MPDRVKSGQNCARCKNPCKTGLKCIKCGVLSHNSCLEKIRNVQMLNDGSVICCAATLLNGSQKVAEQLPAAVIEPGSDADKITIKFLEKLNLQKDLTIKNQEIAINALMEQVSLLKQRTEELLNLGTVSPTTAHDGNCEQKQTGLQRHITNKDASLAIMTAQTRNTCGGVINLNNDVNPHRRNNSRRILTGKKESLENCPFKAAVNNAQSHYHVTNMGPDTDQSELQVYLKGFAPNVQVVKMNARRPDLYASFKISVPRNEAEPILNCEIWPTDVIVNEFFPPKRSSEHYRQRRGDASTK
ncbi:unnamed protein product [Psylliodes chrysocephalus]|uniref:Phorbol-ester/DAG-type domain-containing protein n=1 Tax=Psylliodes chrysocephalus TaxID=3402493 RepID=A0A9P0CBM7_9CUCU|nr:unnamed protein product [Psylliodes chrysocephala]